MPRTKLQLKPISTATKDLALTAGSTQIPLAAVRLRKGANTRPLTARHVVELAESIAVLDLLEPIIIDTAGHLLAGGHRLAALQLLAVPTPADRRLDFIGRCTSTDPEKPAQELVHLADRLSALGETPLPTARIPVQVVDTHRQSGTDLALAIEAAENNVRRQYTNDEITDLAKRFKAAGYKTTAGKPRAGQTTMLGALEAAVGRSKRQIQRILDGGDTRSGKTEWDKAIAALLRAAARVIKAGKRRESTEAQAIVKAARNAQQAIQA